MYVCGWVANERRRQWRGAGNGGCGRDTRGAGRKRCSRCHHGAARAKRHEYVCTGWQPSAKIRALSRLFMRLLIFNPPVYLPLRAHITFLMRPAPLCLPNPKFRSEMGERRTKREVLQGGGEKTRAGMIKLIARNRARIHIVIAIAFLDRERIYAAL